MARQAELIGERIHRGGLHIHHPQGLGAVGIDTGESLSLGIPAQKQQIGQTIGIKIGQLHIPHPGQGVADAQSAEVAVLKRQARHQISSLAQHIVSEDGAGCGETARGN